MANATIKVEYETLPNRQTKQETITIGSNRVCFSTVIKGLTGKNVTGYWMNGWYYRPTEASGVERVTATLVLKKLTISGFDIKIGKDRHSKAGWSAGDSFQGSPELEEVIIESGRCEIGADAFLSCKSLRKVVMSDGVTAIGSNAFEGCMSLSTLDFPSRLKSIGTQAFFGCSQLGAAILPNGLESIGEGAFKGCRSLTKVSFPPTLRTIGKEAFHGCSSLKAAILPSTISSIGTDVFASCRSLQYLVLPSSINDVEGIGSINRGLLLVCDPSDQGDDPLVLTIGGNKYEYVLATRDGVKALCMSKAIDSSCHEEAVRVANAASVTGRITGNVNALDDAESLLKYLKVVSEAETSVLQLTEALSLASSTKMRIEEMKSRRRSLDSYLDSEQAKEQRERLSVQQRNWEAERRAISSGSRLSASDTGREPVPSLPTPQPIKPKEPTPEKPGLFNRRKVEARNAEASRQYQESLAAYEVELAKVNEENAQKEAAYKDAMAAFRSRRESAIQRQLSALGPRPNTIPQETRRDDGVIAELETALFATDTLCQELKRQLEEASGFLKLAYSADIVFPKYRNVEAMTTMYEYFETGRCSTLKGPDGAYNLYESELRSDAIIGKLDVVSDKLDAISDQLRAMQANQYLLYRAVEGVGERLDSMTGMLGDILAETRDTNQTAQEISAKATMMVRDSAEIAYWSRKNAELTDSLGYLIAFAAL